VSCSAGLNDREARNGRCERAFENGLRELTQSGDYAYCVDIAHFMADHLRSSHGAVEGRPFSCRACTARGCGCRRRLPRGDRVSVVIRPSDQVEPVRYGFWA